MTNQSSVGGGNGPVDTEPLCFDLNKVCVGDLAPCVVWEGSPEDRYLNLPGPCHLHQDVYYEWTFRGVGWPLGLLPWE